MIDHKVIDGCIRHDRQAQYEMYRWCFTRYMSLCQRYQKDKYTAESVLNLAFMKILDNLKKYSQQYSFEAWCRRIIVNTNIDHFRQEKRYIHQVELQENQGDNGYSEQELFETEFTFDESQLLSYINQLPPITQKVFNLYAIDEYTHKEIGGLLDISPNTSKWHLSTARKKLQSMMRTTLELRKKVSYEKED